MHFSIPDTEEFKLFTGSSYTGFNVHINGSFHCCVRYKQLHSLHEQLKRVLVSINDSSIVLPLFPPKKFLPLTSNQLEERRIQLERYLQLIGQDPITSKLELLQNFLLNAQQESASIESREINLDIFLMNDYLFQVQCLTTENSSKILSKACQILDLPQKYQNYFALFLMRKNFNIDNIELIRKLMDFESPYISHRSNEDCQIVIRKCYWDPCYDLQLMKDKFALNLLYVQAVDEINRDWIITTNEIKEKLNDLKDSANKREYLDVARKLPSYGTVCWNNCLVNYPEGSDNLMATIVVGNNELSIRNIIESKKQETKIQETKFKVTRMRCWRVTTIHNNEGADNEGKQKPKLELSFEYLMNKNNLKWVTISSENAMIISVCLQSMVDELINQKEGNDYDYKIKPSIYTPLSYIKRDNDSSSRISDSSDSTSLNDMDMQSSEPFSMRRKIRNKISTTVFFKNRDESVHNPAFSSIGDDDL